MELQENVLWKDGQKQHKRKRPRVAEMSKEAATKK
jgi:hypothetical protein